MPNDAFEVDIGCGEPCYPKRKTLYTSVGVVYLLYFLVAISLIVALAFDHGLAAACHVFAIVVTFMHLLAIVISKAFIIGYVHLSVQPIALFIFSDVIQAWVCCVSAVALAVANEPSLVSLAYAVLIVLSLAQIPCFYRTYIVIDKVE